MSRPKLLKLVNKQVRVILTDGRYVIGKLLTFDSHMNVVVDNTQEFRKTKSGDSAQRSLGLVVLRGDQIVSVSADDHLKSTTTQPITLQL